LQAQHLKLGCTPIVNLFQQPGEPIRVTHQKASYPVVVDARKPLAYEVVQLQRVVRVEKSAEGERSEEVAPFYATRHGSHLKAPRFYWHASRENSRRQSDKGSEMELHLVDLQFNAVRPASEVLSLSCCAATATCRSRFPLAAARPPSARTFPCPAIR
jgi:type VI secretion system protein ImpG